MGLAVGVLGLIAKDFRNYWLAIFALVLPLEIKKLLFDSEYALNFFHTYGFPVGELPGPVLYLSDLPFLVLMIHWFFELTFKKQKIFFPKSNWMALAFILWSGVSLINATVLSSGLFDLFRMLKFYILYLYVANNVWSKEAVKTLIMFLLIGMIFQGLICLYQFILQDTSSIFGNIFGQQVVSKELEAFYKVSEESGLRRAGGTVGHINGQAQYFEFLLPVAFLLWLTATRFLSYFFYFTTLFLGLLGLIVTFSRGGTLGITVGMLAVLLLSTIFKLISYKKFLTFLLIGLGILIAISPLVYKFMTIRPYAAKTRFHLTEVGLEMLKAHPVLGVGLNNHMVQKLEYDPRSYPFPLPAHNHYLIIASEVGIPGLVFFLGFMFLSFKLALSAARVDDLYLASVAVGILGALIAISVHILVDYVSTHTIMTLLWLYAGLAAALSRWKVKSSEKILYNGSPRSGKYISR